ncbi:MAG: nucleotide-binding universal stress UspA family protein [Granulosicoccus sp.]|jgi:nucleotide-binding universal stress UspA family protein
MVTQLTQQQGNRMHVDVVELPDAEVEVGLQKAGQGSFSFVLVCLDGTAVSSGVIPYAETLATSIHANLRLLTVLEPDHESETPSDPVEWSLRRREATQYLKSLVTKNCMDTVHTYITVLEGKSATAIGNYLCGTGHDISVFCRKDELETGHIGSTSRCVLERCSGSIFLIPAHKTTTEFSQFHRIMVPLDGSARAESVLPTIRNIALACNAIVVLVHAEPRSDIAETMPGDMETVRLKAALSKHNESAAQHYLDRISQRLRQSGVDVETQVVTGGDSRRQLIETVHRELIDLVVLSSHGVSGHTDVPFGDIAGHMMSRSPVPILMLRDTFMTGSATVMARLSESSARAPEGAS